MADYPQTKEAVALELTKLIIATGISRTEKNVLNIYSKCLLVVEGKDFEEAEGMLKKRREIAEGQNPA